METDEKEAHEDTWEEEIGTCIKCTPLIWQHEEARGSASQHAHILMSDYSCFCEPGDSLPRWGCCALASLEPQVTFFEHVFPGPRAQPTPPWADPG